MPPKNTNQARWYETHLQPHEPVIRAWLHSRYANLLDIDDIIQEALIRVLKVRDHEEIRSPKAFFFALARNAAVDSIRKSRISTQVSLTESDVMNVADDAASVDETVARNHEIEILTKAIQSLPKRCRRVFTLSKVYGMTYNEIADEMGITFNTVSAQIAIGMSKCTAFMNRYGRD